MSVLAARAKTRKLFDLLSANFWFIPSVCILLALSLQFASVALDQTKLLDDLLVFKFFYGIEPNGARTILATIASALITVTSIAFSMIVVTLTLASSQFGPRLLRNFMQNKKTQVALGLFVATFIFCLALIRYVRSDGGHAFVPGSGLLVALILTLMSVIVLVFLIHHLAVSIQADDVINSCWLSLRKDIDRMLPKAKKEQSVQDVDLTWAALPVNTPLCVESSGYIQGIDYQQLCSLMTEKSCRMTLHVKPGEYVTAMQQVATLHSGSAISEDLAIEEYFVTGHTRTPIQDPEFAINQLVEIGLRALSPSINDPFTAISCINRLGSALALMSTRDFPQKQLVDKHNIVRLVRATIDFESAVNSACNQLRQACVTHPTVIIALLEMLIRVAKVISSDDVLAFFLRQGQALVEQSETVSINLIDRADIEDRLSTLSLACS